MAYQAFDIEAYANKSEGSNWIFLYSHQLDISKLWIWN